MQYMHSRLILVYSLNHEHRLSVKLRKQSDTFPVLFYLTVLFHWIAVNTYVAFLRSVHSFRLLSYNDLHGIANVSFPQCCPVRTYKTLYYSMERCSRRNDNLANRYRLWSRQYIGIIG